MSAWITSRRHIDVVVGGLILQRLIPFGAATTTGRMLWGENVRSVEYRYPDDETRDTLPGPIEYTPPEQYEYTPPGEPDDLTIVTAAHSYRYQSCEHPTWDTSESCRLVEALIAALPVAEARFKGERTAEDRAITAAAWSI